MCIFKDYKNIFGEPGKGVHSYRIMNIAIVDLLLTIIAAYFIGRYFKITFVKSFIYLFILSIILHFLFCVNTTITKIIFGLLN